MEWVRFVPLEGWLAYLCQGWRLPDHGGCLGPYHGIFSVLMVREDDPN